MKFEIYIANRFSKTKKGENNQLSNPMIKIATFGVILGVAVMLISVAIILGFKKEIREKVTGFWAHIQLVNFDMNRSFENKPIGTDWDFLPEIKQYDHVKYIQPFITKPGVLKEDDELEAIVLKGVDQTYDWSFFNKYLIDGQILNIDSTKPAGGILISSYIASRLKLEVGNRVSMYFMQKPVRMRSFVVKGVFQTNLKIYDELYAIVDLRHLQKLNGWDTTQVSGFEVIVDDFDQIVPVDLKISKRIALTFNEYGEALRTVTTLEVAPQIYDWLNLTNMNVWVILILITLVAGINMVTGLLIMILERANNIGLFKSMGATDRQIGRIFILNASKIIGKGMVIGNVVGLLLCYLQYEYGVIKLDPDNYYLSEVPIFINWFYFVILNAGVFVTNLIMMVLPSMVISKIQPARVIKFD